jgi:hypothetical protein
MEDKMHTIRTRVIVSMCILFMLASVTGLKADQVHGRVIYNYMTYCGEGGFCDSVIHVGIRTGGPDWYRVLHPPERHDYIRLRQFYTVIEWCQLHGKEVSIIYSYGDVGNHNGWKILNARTEGGIPSGWTPPEPPPASQKPAVLP